eukprot:TRINITY_DN7759_c0_g2_i1.p1 TRINITY_DN7759_c0_g2~~TRINITY_DN7759_c0_g2_i1.p1  ORF type:complete len:550 (-),score=113.58 TRINITY_DN7759_c0_g2_i1:82-1731(-)
MSRLKTNGYSFSTLLLILSLLLTTNLVLGKDNQIDETIQCITESDGNVQCGNKIYYANQNQESFDKLGSGAFWIDIIVCIALLIVSGMMSGLTLGLLSLDIMNLEIIIKGGDHDSAAKAKKILPLVKKHHLLLVTLLLANAACMETLPIFLDKMVPAYAAILLSVTLVLLFGEILPQAACSRYGLAIGARLTWFVWGVMILLFPISWPIAKLLDCILGKDESSTFYRRGELKELLSRHQEDSRAGGGLTVDETTIMKGALDMIDKKAHSIMTPLEEVFMVELMDSLTKEFFSKVIEKGHSRIPVYRDTREHIIGVLLAKNLIGVYPGDTKLKVVDDLPLRQIPHISGQLPLYDLLNQFQTGRSHMAVVISPDDHITPLGIVTIEDVIEELIQEEIYDESDLHREKGRQEREKNRTYRRRHSQPAMRTAHVAPAPDPVLTTFHPSSSENDIGSPNGTTKNIHNNNNNNNNSDSSIPSLDNNSSVITTPGTHDQATSTSSPNKYKLPPILPYQQFLKSPLSLSAPVLANPNETKPDDDPSSEEKINITFLL